MSFDWKYYGFRSLELLPFNLSRALIESIRAMFTSAFTAITSFGVILSCKYQVSIIAHVIVFWSQF